MTSQLVLDQPLRGRQNERMAKKKTEGVKRKPFAQVRVRRSLAAQLDKLVTRNDTDVTEEVNRAVREYLERNQLWPPKDAEK